MLNFKLWAAIGWLLAVLFALPGIAQQDEPQATQPPTTEEESAAPPRPEDYPVPPTIRAVPRFTPSETINADDAVSFPVDI